MPALIKGNAYPHLSGFGTVGQGGHMPKRQFLRNWEEFFLLQIGPLKYWQCCHLSGYLQLIQHTVYSCGFFKGHGTQKLCHTVVSPIFLQQNVPDCKVPDPEQQFGISM